MKIDYIEAKLGIQSPLLLLTPNIQFSRIDDGRIWVEDWVFEVL